MKKTAITLLLTAVAASAGAQTMYDALMFSESDYAGTARTMAMGNAFTALGGDLGSLSLNPAGSAVAQYSQIVLSPGMVLSANTANGTLAYGETVPSSFNKKMRNTSGNFWVPNFGFSVNFDTHRESGVKNVAIGLVANVTNTYRDALYAKGLNTTSSFASGMATMAYGFPPDDLGASNAYDNFAPANWKYPLAWNSYMIHEDPTDEKGYFGVTENFNDETQKISRAGNVNQIYGRSINGNRYDCLLNVGLNISDKVYIGANLGMTSLKYGSEEYFTETPEEYSFFKTGFQKLKYNSYYNASGSGIYGKFGIIVTPAGGLRIGAAIQTPTMTTIKETWKSSASVESSSSDYSGSAETPEGEYRYRLTSPMRFNIGAAYAFGSFAVLSADYEICNYRTMRFTELNTSDNSGFDSVNEDIREFMGASHYFRAGVEIKPINCFAIRAGYGVTTAPDFYYGDAGNKLKSDAKAHKYSFGIGYSSKGSFFIDLAVAFKKCANEYITPYETALMDEDGIVLDDNLVPIADYNLSPEILNRKTIWTAAITFGWRF